MVVDKFVGDVKKNGSRTQYKQALELMLPTSSLYEYLEGRVPHPSHTYTRIVEIVEAEEKETINRLIGERRTRLGARIGQVTDEVRREVLERSDLELLYQSIVDWTNDDDLRRIYEEKIFQRAYDTLAVLPPQSKAEKRAHVQKLAEGLVILKHPYALAWQVVLEWSDVEDLEKLDIGVLQDYVELFPDDGLSKVLRAFLESDISPFPKFKIDTKSQTEEVDTQPELSGDDRLLLMIEGADESSRSALSQRCMARYFVYLEEYSNAVDSARKALELVDLERKICGLEFTDNSDAVKADLATALIHHQTPRYHAESRKLFDDILARKPDQPSALLGVGLILEEEEQYDEAISFLIRAQNNSSDLKVKAETAWCRALNGDHKRSKDELESCLSAVDISNVRLRDFRAQTLYRIGVCIWNIDKSRSSRKDRNGAYARFISCLQADPNHASAYTSLGIYFADYAKDKMRARKSFQKAFELSASEVEAAERLARAFADQAEWDLVELVAQRTVDSGKVKPPPGSKKRGLSWPFAALGVVQLNNQEYAKSIVSFQAALRINSGDYYSWVGLGESYHNSGRYIAATKAFDQAQSLEGNLAETQRHDAWFSQYMLANVKRELGDYKEAILDYEKVLESKSEEYGVSIALVQTHVESAWKNIQLGFFGDAAEDAAAGLSLARKIVEYRPQAFNLWKAVGDACSIFSWTVPYTSVFPLADVRLLLDVSEDTTVYEQLSEVDGINRATVTAMFANEDSAISLVICMSAAVMAHKRAIHVCSGDIHAQAVAWFNLGCTEHRAHSCLYSQTKSKVDRTKQLKAAVRCFKRAIELEAKNADFWNALGIVTTQMNPKVAQHSFVRSLFLNDKSAMVWTNLGTLFLLQNEYQLANEAFTRAQSQDPDYTHAWIGQAILATLLGETIEARGLFAHAFEISDSSSLIAKRQYSLSTFDHLLSSPFSSNQTIDTLQPLFALHQLRSQIAPSTIFQHLSALLSERICDTASSIPALVAVCSAVESDYEVSESASSLSHFAHAKADLARSQLSAKDYASAAENAEMALDLSSDADSIPDTQLRNKYRLSAHLTAGIAYHYLQNLDAAISMFRTALEETDGTPDVVCVLAQVLWAKGGEDERGVAKEQLIDCLDRHPGHPGTVSILGAIAVLEGDTESMMAVSEDLHSLRVIGDTNVRRERETADLLEALAIAGAEQSTNGNSEVRKEVQEAQAAVMLAPHQQQGWSTLGNVTEDDDAASEVAQMALLTALQTVKGKVEEIGAGELAQMYAGTGKVADAQRAVLFAPWVVDGWEALAA